MSFRANFTLALLWIGTRSISGFVAISHPPELVLDLYIPFTKNFLAQPTFDPWNTWLENGGSPDAFPYSWPLVAFMAISLLIGGLLENEILGWLLTTLFIDLLITICIGRINEGKKHSHFTPVVLWTVSPTPLIGIALIGSLDFLPGLFLLLSLLGIQKKRFRTVGLLVGLAIASKLLIAVAVFALFAFAFRYGTSPRESRRLVGAVLISSAIFTAPLFYSFSFLTSFAASPAASGPLTWGVGNENYVVFIWPIGILAVWLVTWRVRRFSFGLLVVAIATPLALTASMPGAAPGWTIWSLPLILPLIASLPKRFLVLGFVSLNMSAFSFASLVWIEPLVEFEDGLLASSVSTVVIGITTIFLYLAWRELVTKSDFLRLHSRPALVLISGDSGVGKDTLSDGLARALGERWTVQLSGDNYHLWDRGQGAWKYVTHLNPQANDLSTFYDDVLKLYAGEEIRVGAYDHKLGRKLKPNSSKSREFIIVSGLHAMWSPEVNSQAQLRVFLEMSEDLRVELKLARDLSQRRQTEDQIRDSINRRKLDSEKYIFPQSQSADLIIRISRLAAHGVLSNQQITFDSSNKLFDVRLVSELLNTCNLEALIHEISPGYRSIVVRGETDARSLSMAFERLEPRVARVLQIDDSWSEGAPGIIQLVTLVYLANSLRLERLV